MQCWYNTLQLTLITFKNACFQYSNHHIFSKLVLENIYIVLIVQIIVFELTWNQSLLSLRRKKQRTPLARMMRKEAVTTKAVNHGFKASLCVDILL